MSLRRALTYVEIDVPKCSLTYGVLPCEALLGVTGDIKCFNSLGTCQDREHFDAYGGNDFFAKILLHFDGPDGTQVATDEAEGGMDHVFTPNGGVAIDTSEFKFGGASSFFDGVDDYWSTPDAIDLTLGAGGGTFAIDAWFNCAATGGTARAIAGQVHSSGLANADSSWSIARNASNVLVASVVSGTTVTTVTGTTQFTDALNAGWHHVAFFRIGNILKMFVDGIQEGGNVAFSSVINNSTPPMSIGRPGNVNGDYWSGWIDEFRLSIGTARWS